VSQPLGPIKWLPAPVGPGPDTPPTALQNETAAREAADAVLAADIAAETARAMEAESLASEARHAEDTAAWVLSLDLSAAPQGVDPGFGRLWLSGTALQIGSPPAAMEKEDVSGHWQLEDGSGNWFFA
jgi:hypothetical protein